MDKEVFRDQLRRGLGIVLSAAEMEEILHLFDSDGSGTCDGGEFLVNFYRFRFEHRSKLLTERIAAEKRLKAIAEERVEKRKDEYEKKGVVTVNYNFSQDTFDSAVEKIRSAAVKYDRLMPGTVQLNAFDGSEMTPKVFKEQLKHVFNIKLTPDELGAVLHFFDKNGDGVINCAEFLIQFFRIAFEEKSKSIRKEREKKKMFELEREMKAKQQLEELEKKNALKVN